VERDAEALFRGVFETAPDAVVVVDSAGVIVRANPQCLAVFGGTPADLVGTPVEALVPMRFRDTHPTRRAGYGDTANPRPMGLLRLAAVRRDGSEFPAEISLAPIEVDGQRFVSATVRDITERLEMQAESQRLRDDVIATVSHELRTPLTSIIGYAELMGDLDEADLSRRARKLLSVIERNASRELQLVNDLLTMAFLGDDRLRMRRESLELERVCHQVVEDQRLRARERALTLAFTGGETGPVVGDFHRVLQVIENVVSNSLKFTRAGGSIDIAILDHGAMGVIEVRDTGIGVSPEEQDRLFERLYRSPRAIADQVPGAGLGLPIARAIVEAHGGWIDLQSELGVGTVVRVALPHHERPAAE
jgi:PAS domain S-box-containing protein